MRNNIKFNKKILHIIKNINLVNDMGVKIESSEIIIIRFIIYYLLLSASCDIKLITCDIHHMIQSYYNNSRNNTVGDGVMDIDTTTNFKINATELEQHIMNGLNMKTKPDVKLVCGIFYYF